MGAPPLSFIMKVQVLFSVLPFLAGITAAFPQEGASVPAAVSTPSTTTGVGAGPAPVSEIDETDDLEGVVFDDETEAQFEADDPDLEDSSDSLPIIDGPEKRGLPSKLTWNNKYSFKKRFIGILAKGESAIVMYKNGNVRFFTKFWAIKLLNYKYSVACALSDRDGRVYTLERKGRVCGNWKKRIIKPILKPIAKPTPKPLTKTPVVKAPLDKRPLIWPICRRTHRVDRTKFDVKVRNNWDDIVGGDMHMNCRASFSWSLNGMFVKILDDLKKPTSVIKEKIKIF